MIAEEAGALVTNFDGRPDYVSAPQSIIAAAPDLHAKLMSALHAPWWCIPRSC